MAETKTKNIYQALLEVQKELKPVTKGETADTGKFSYSYADLNSVYDESLPKLHAHGLLLLQPTRLVDGQPVLVTRIVHVESGESVEGEYPIVAVDKNDPQKIGASVTYSRRYGLLSLLGMATEDDDALSASGHSKAAPRASQPASRPAANRTTGEVVGDSPETTESGECSHCGKFVPGKSVYWSNKKHGRTLCWNDQKALEAGELDDPKNNHSPRNGDDELDSLFKTSMEK